MLDVNVTFSGPSTPPPTSTITFTTDGAADQVPDEIIFYITNQLNLTIYDMLYTGSGSDGSIIDPSDIYLTTPIPPGGNGRQIINFSPILDPNVTYTLTSTPTFTPAPVPEPNTIVLLSIGLLGLGAIDVRRRMRAGG
jgi:hypothetical protein